MVALELIDDDVVVLVTFITENDPANLWSADDIALPYPEEDWRGNWRDPTFFRDR